MVAIFLPGDTAGARAAQAQMLEAAKARGWETIGVSISFDARPTVAPHADDADADALDEGE